MRKRIIYFAGAISLFAILLWAYAPHKNPGGQLPLGGGNMLLDVKGERSWWEARIAEAGAKAAYEEFRNTYRTKEFGAQHLGSHLIGSLLYEKEGVGGVGVCDQSFAFGCYHGFFGRAVAAESPSVVPLLDKACLEAYTDAGTGCQHGIGHGLMEYFGHDRLLDALRACDATKQLSELSGCAAGAFMEYNIPIVLAPGAARNEIRKLDSANPLEPCNTIAPSHQRKSCYFEISLWWNQVLGRDYAKMGKLCGSLRDRGEGAACFLGVGNIIASSRDYDAARTRDGCGEMGSARGDALCRIGAAWRFFGTDDHKDAGHAICEGLDAFEGYRCISGAPPRS